VDVLRVSQGSFTALIPLESIAATVRVTQQDITRTAQGESLLFQGQVLPHITLNQLMHAPPGHLADGKAAPAVILKASQGLVALGVAQLGGTANVVLRPLPDLAPASPAIAGAALDGEGFPELVLDADGVSTEAQRLVPSLPAGNRPAPKILIVDDSLTTRMLEQSILESAGYVVDLACSAEEGLEMALQQPYALFLVDVEMPGMDGFSFLQTTRGSEELRHIPGVLVTSRDSLEDKQRGRDVGAQGYIVKSQFDQTELVALIERLLGMGR
jgi:two-component system chemotaxis sensor kinase CheA